jgi:agmatinase
MPRTTAPSATSFLGAPVAPDPAAVRARFAFLGVPFGVPYDMAGVCPPSAGAAEAVRAASWQFVGEHDHYDFDLGGPLAADGRLDLVDCGDVAGDPRDLAATARGATACVRDLVAGGATPLVVGGDHAIPPLVVAGLDHTRELNILQIDAHLDYRDEVDGVRDGYSSPIRRLRELPFVGDIVQVGLRGSGSARVADVEAALAAGNVLITADQVHDAGVAVVLDRLRAGARYYITIDVDGLDPGCAPGAGWPLPGGLQFGQAAAIVRAVARVADVAGIDFCEFVPRLDLNGLTALTVTRLLINLIGVTAHKEAGSRGVA